MPRKQVKITEQEYYELVKSKEDFEELVNILGLDMEKVKELVKQNKFKRFTDKINNRGMDVL